jgi:hypothetical protein
LVFESRSKESSCISSTAFWDNTFTSGPACRTGQKWKEHQYKQKWLFYRRFHSFFLYFPQGSDTQREDSMQRLWMPHTSGMYVVYRPPSAAPTEVVRAPVVTSSNTSRQPVSASHLLGPNASELSMPRLCFRHVSLLLLRPCRSSYIQFPRGTFPNSNCVLSLLHIEMACGQVRYRLTVAAHTRMFARLEHGSPKL